MNTTWKLICIAALLPPMLAAGPRDLSESLQPIVEKYKLPGMTGAILHGNMLVAIGSAGVRKAGDPQPMLSTDIVHLGSDTKAMTALLIGRLIDQKQLAFDTRMADLFPDLAGQMNADAGRITVRNLLDHTGGFPHDLNWQVLQSSDRSMQVCRRSAVLEALSAAPVKPIGTFAYSNVGYVLLGAIVELKTGKPWEDVMRQEIFGPLKMDTAGFGPPGEIGKIDQPWGHVRKNDSLVPVQSDNPDLMGPAGTVHCSIEDWSKFIAEVLSGSQGRPTLISASTFKELTTPRPQNHYAGGWLVTQRPWAGGLAFTHNGSNTMWMCDVWIAPGKNFAVMVATNYGGDDAAEAADEAIASLIKLSGELEQPIQR